MKFKKSILALGSLAAIAAPVAAVVSCGVTEDSKSYDISGTENANVKNAYDVFAKEATIQKAVESIINGYTLFAKQDAIKDSSDVEVIPALAGDIKAKTGSVQSVIVKKVAGIADNVLVATYKVTTDSTGLTELAKYTDTKDANIQIGFISTASTVKVLLVTDQGATVKAQFNIVSAAEAKRFVTEATAADAALTAAKKAFDAAKTADTMKAVVDAAKKADDAKNAVAHNKATFAEVKNVLDVYTPLAKLIK